MTAQSQPFRLRERMEEAKIRHGQEVRADLTNVRVTGARMPTFGWVSRLMEPKAPSNKDGEVFFCNMGPIRVKETVANGDDHPLPSNVILEGLQVPDSGSYDILDAIIRSNGDIRLVVDHKTRIVPAAREVGAGLV